MSKVRVRSLERPPRLWLLPVAAFGLGAALVAGAGVAQAQDAEEPVDAGIDGTWVVDTEIGDFEDFSSSWVGFRVNEVLNPGGEVQAVGRTPAVSGQLEASGSVIESAIIEADLTAIISDRPRRDGAIQRALETAQFPAATFVSREPVDLGQVPVEGEPFTTFGVTMPTAPIVVSVEDSGDLEWQLFLTRQAGMVDEGTADEGTADDTADDEMAEDEAAGE